MFWEKWVLYFYLDITFTSIIFLGEVVSIFILHVTFMCIVLLGKVIFVFAFHITSKCVVFFGFNIGNHLHFKFKHKTFNYSFNLCILHIMFVPLCWLYHNPFETICTLNFIQTFHVWLQIPTISIFEHHICFNFGVSKIWPLHILEFTWFFQEFILQLWICCNLFPLSSFSFHFFFFFFCEDNSLFTTFHALIVYQL